MEKGCNQMGIHQILYDRRVQEALDAYNAAHGSDLVLRVWTR